jgi:hypothetical protein
LSHSRGSSYHQATRSITTPYLGRERRSNGVYRTRSTANVCCSPPQLIDGAARRMIASNAVGQSFSIPSVRPIRCSAMAAPLSGVDAETSAPGSRS